jgi:uncharacterized membrane protein required for colicin V production
VGAQNVIAYENLFDLLVLLLLVTAFIIGYLQGSVRRLLGIAATIFSVIVAAQLRAPLGDYLVANWTQFPAEYSRMLGFGLVFIALSIAFTIAIEIIYERSPVLPRFPIVDPLLGGILGVIEGIVFLAVLIIILDSFFRTPIGVAINPSELPLLRDFDKAITVSQTARVLREDVIPVFFLGVGGLFPRDIRDLFPRL